MRKNCFFFTKYVLNHLAEVCAKFGIHCDPVADKNLIFHIWHLKLEKKVTGGRCRGSQDLVKTQRTFKKLNSKCGSPMVTLRLKTVFQWLKHADFENSGQKASFKPKKSTISGPGGTGGTGPGTGRYQTKNQFLRDLF